MHFAVDGAQRNMIYQTGEAEAQVSWLRVHTTCIISELHVLFM